MGVGFALTIMHFNLRTTIFCLDFDFEARLFSNLLRFEHWLKQDLVKNKKIQVRWCFSILFSKELWTSVNVLAHKPINKFIRGIFRVNLKLSRLKTIRQNLCDARLFRWNIWEGTFWKLGGKTGVTTFFALYLETMKWRKIHQKWRKIHQPGYREKNITCEIRCLLLHLNVPSVVLYWLLDA